MLSKVYIFYFCTVNFVLTFSLLKPDPEKTFPGPGKSYGSTTLAISVVRIQGSEFKGDRLTSDHF